MAANLWHLQPSCMWNLVRWTYSNLHVPEKLEDLHGPDDNVLDRLLANATQRSCVDVPRCLSLLLLLLRC